MRTLLARLRLWLGFAVFWVIGLLPHRVRYQRSPHIPRSGPALLVVNHLSTTETTAVARLVIGHRRFPHFLILQELFRWPVIGWVATKMRQIPVHRRTSKAAAAIDDAVRELDAGHVVVIYPEGGITKTPDLRPGPGRSGAARIALARPDTPVIPIGQWGARPGLSSALRRRTVELHVGSAIDLGRWRGRTDAQAVDEVTDQIMTTITGLVESARGDRFDSSESSKLGTIGSPATFREGFNGRR